LSQRSSLMTSIEILWNGVEASKAKLTNKEYFVRGCTALLDAVGKTLLDVGYRLSKTNADERPGKVICVITTEVTVNGSKVEFAAKGEILYPNGAVFYNGELKDGMPAGKGTYYDPEGNMLEKVTL